MRGRSAALAVLATPSRVQTIVRVATFAMLAVELLWLALVALDPHRVPIGAREVARLSRSARWAEVPDREFIQSNTTYEHIDGPHGGRHIYTTTYIATLDGVTWRRTVTRDNYPDRPGPDDVIDLVRTPSMSELAIPFADCARSLPVRQPDPPVTHGGRLRLARVGNVSLFVRGARSPWATSLSPAESLGGRCPLRTPEVPFPIPAGVSTSRRCLAAA